MNAFGRRQLIAASIAMLTLSVFASDSIAALNAYLQIKDSTGKQIIVPVRHDGSFQTPPLAAGEYTWSFVASHSGTASTGSTGRMAAGGEELPKESVTSISVSSRYVQGPRDAMHGAVTGKRMHTPLVVMKKLDLSSPKLMTADLGNFVIDAKGDAIAGKITPYYQHGGKASMDSWDGR